MGVSLTAQSSSLLLSLLLGAVAAIVYDGLRALRLSRRHSRLWAALTDAAFCLTLIVLYPAFSLRIGGGELRLYMLFFSFAGFVLYFLLFSPLLQSFWRFWADTLLALLRLFLLPLRCLKNFYGKLTKLYKSPFLFLRRRFIMRLYTRTDRRNRQYGEGKKDTAQHFRPAHAAFSDGSRRRSAAPYAGKDGKRTGGAVRT